MAKPFDATTKQLVEADPLAWIHYAGLQGTAAELIDADLATITTEADRVLRVQAGQPYLAHLEFQASYDSDLGRRALRYSVLLHYRHQLPVRSVVVLLRREADGPEMTGRVRYEAPEDTETLDFRYSVIRVWERPVEEVLAGDLETLPLAPLANVSRAALPGVIARMQERMARDAAPAEAKLLWTATYLLMGLKYSAQFAEELLKGVQGMEESTTYQALLARGEERGKVEGERSLLLRLGRKRFGEPDAKTLSALEAIASIEELERLAERLLEAESWQEMLPS